MIAIQMLFLIFLLYTAERYLVMKISSKEHRLLPVIIVLAGLFNFYRVVECVTEYNDVFRLLEQLLSLQVVFAVIHYKKDFLRMKLFHGGNLLLFINLVISDVILVYSYYMHYDFGFVFHINIFIDLVILAIMDFYILFFMQLKKREKIVGYFLATSCTLVLISGIIAEPADGGWGMILTPAALFIVEIGLNILMHSGYIVDSAYLLKEHMYDDSDISTFLYDEDGYLIDANEAAKQTLPNVRPATSKYVGDNYYDKLHDLMAVKNQTNEIKIDGCVYRAHLVEETYMGHVRGYILYLVDLTQEKQENILMQSLMREAESATEMKSRFLASMSHELRSPLHAIIGFCDILSRQSDISKHNKKMVVNIHNAGETLLKLVNGILDYSKIEAGKFQLKEDTYDFENIFKGVLQECIINRQDKKIDISVAMETTYPKQLFGDELRVRDVVQNLMSNAVKYTNEGKIECKVSCEAVEDNQTKVVVIVRDTGIGMNDEQLQQVFEEYATFIGEKHTEGTGLGLPIVKRFCEMMGGEVTVHSEKGSGSIFTASFYQKLVDDKMYAPITFTEHNLISDSYETKEIIHPDWVYPQARVLVVDDMQVNLDLFKEIADLWELKVDTVLSGQDAIYKIMDNPYDMVFMDNMMPHMTGIEATAEIRKFSKVPLIILTADISEETKVRSQQCGATELLEKPLKLAELNDVLNEYMPLNYRKEVTKESPIATFDKTKLRLTRTFVREAQAISDEIEEIFQKKDMEMFRIKVHGLKGASRNVGLEEMGERSEVMEMAAKVENVRFIERHLETYKAFVQEEINKLRIQLENAQAQENSVSDEAAKASNEPNESIDELFAHLRKKFDNYDLTGIEEELLKLQKQQLSEDDKELINQLQKAYENLEYEEGSNLLSERKN